MKENPSYKLYLGSHISLSSPDYFLGSVKEALSYNENALMVYTGAPQNTIRKDISGFKIQEAVELLKANDIKLENVIIHAPYIINLCSEKPETRLLAQEFLIKEIKRSEEMGVKYIVLHPGSRLKQPLDLGLEQVIDGLNYVFSKHPTDVVICIETMSGKGSEVGVSLEEIKRMIDGVESKKNVGVCLDTCHINDAGYDVGEIDSFLDQFDKLIGINYLKVIHLNDSKNPLGAHKDRHENLGYGSIGFEKLLKVVYHPLLDGIVKILETPYVSIDFATEEDKLEKKKKIQSLPPYKYEIQALREKKWFDFKSLIEEELVKKYQKN